MSDKRRERRLLCAELVQVTFRAHSGRTCFRVTNLEDISSTGVCLQSETAIREGTEVAVDYGYGQFVGMVRYCVFRETGFLIGVEFAHGCKWSQSRFQPEHLLDPQDVAGEQIR